MAGIGRAVIDLASAELEPDGCAWSYLLARQGRNSSLNMWKKCYVALRNETLRILGKPSCWILIFYQPVNLGFTWFLCIMPNELKLRQWSVRGSQSERFAHIIWWSRCRTDERDALDSWSYSRISTVMRWNFCLDDFEAQRRKGTDNNETDADWL